MHETRYIYSVGKPDLGSRSIQHIKAAGYKAGIFIDTAIKPPKNLHNYDSVIPVDFSRLDSEIERLTTLNLPVVGLLCTYENYLTAKATLGAHFNVPSLSLEAAQACTDKYLMRQAFNKHHPSLSPKFALISNGNELEEFIRIATFPVILKPTNLVKSLLVIKCETPDSLRDNYRFALGSIQQLYAKYHVYDRAPHLIAEEFISGQMYSIAAYVDHTGTPHFCPGAVMLTTAQQIGVNDNYLYKRELPADVPPSLYNKLITAAALGIAALAMRSSPAHVELIVQDHAVKIIEIGARTGGYRPRMYALSYGIDLMEAEVALALGQPPRVHGTLLQNTAVYELFPNTDGAFTGLQPPLPGGLAYASVKPAPGDTVGPAAQGYKAAAIVIVSNADTHEFKNQCKQVEATKVMVR